MNRAIQIILEIAGLVIVLTAFALWMLMEVGAV